MSPFVSLGGRRKVDVPCKTLKFWRYAYSVLTLNFTLVMGTSTSPESAVPLSSHPLQQPIRRLTVYRIIDLAERSSRCYTIASRHGQLYIPRVPQHNRLYTSNPATHVLRRRNVATPEYRLIHRSRHGGGSFSEPIGRLGHPKART